MLENNGHKNFWINSFVCLCAFHYANMTKWQLVTLCLPAKPSPRDVARFSDEEKKVNREFERWDAAQALRGGQIHTARPVIPQT